MQMTIYQYLICKEAWPLNNNSHMFVTGVKEIKETQKNSVMRTA